MKNLITIFKKTEEIFTKKKKINQKEETDNPMNDKNYFCCPECNERILISLNPSNFSLSYKCSNNHKETLNYNTFYNKRWNKNILSNKIINNKSSNINSISSIENKNKLKDKNINLDDKLINKCQRHDIDISYYCENCQKNLCIFCMGKNSEDNEHINHKIINFSDIIPDENEINVNNNKLSQKILKNNSLIEELKKCKIEICSLIDDIINKLISEKLIYQMLIKNFNWKYLDYIKYKNYQIAVENLDIKNEKLEKFYNSKTFIEKIKAINDYLFYNNDINNINNEMDKKNENNFINFIKNGNCLIYNDYQISSYSFQNKEFIKLLKVSPDKDKIKKNEIEKNIFNIINNLVNCLENKIGNCNILIWKKEEILKKDKIFNIINDNKNKKFDIIEISDNFNFDFIHENKKTLFGDIFTNNSGFSLSTKNSNNSIFNNGDNSNANESIFSNDINKNNNSKNISGKSLFDSDKNNNKRIFSSINFSSLLKENETKDDDEEEEEEEEGCDEYVYISRTGSKYHGSPQCGRMRTSTMVSIKEAESLGLEPCMKCY